MAEPALELEQAADPHPVLRVSDLRQWAYCPRVAFFTLVCPVHKRESFKMAVGRSKEQRLQHLQRRRTLHKFGLEGGEVRANVQLFSPNLGLTGKLDLLIRQGTQRFPVEVKFTRGPASLNHRVQLAGYALLLEDLFGVPVRHGYVVRLPDDRAESIRIDSELRDVTRTVISAMRNMVRDERTPPANPILARCTDCEYRNFCGDVA